jgi:Asp-tRNA(Asn)/Glu-tRNA(Gln) amidotransferase A subunit family amidase
MLCASSGITATFGEALWKQVEASAPAFTDLPAEQEKLRITRAMVRAAEGVVGVTYTEAQRELMLAALDINLSAYEAIGLISVPNHVQPAIHFSPVPPGRTIPGSVRSGATRPRPAVRRPASNVDLAFLPVTELGELIRTRQVTSTELTRLYLDRLRRHDEVLHCVVTLTEGRALQQAAAADRQIAAGRYLGPLHGIPYGVKDLLAVPGYPTTWGASIYKDRVLDTTATVVERLDAAGAVLVAKLAMGELGLSDAWFGGQTRNPWRPSSGSGGSSSGSAVATSAGLVGFAIGHETMGSIVTPASRNGITGLRPTFGRVSRHGAMTLCWSLDKIGPMARSVEDCAVILEAIAGPDGKDPTVSAVPYFWNPNRPLSEVRVGYFREAFERPRSGKVRDDAALERLRRLGLKLIEVELPTDLPIASLLIVRVEAAAALETIARDGGMEKLVEQGATGWPNFLRYARLIPAYHYVQANRIRTMLMERLDEVFQRVDVFVAPTFGVMPLTNLTGHPCVVVPNGMGDDGLPASISFIGRLFGESRLCTIARAFQQASGSPIRHPAGFS